MIKDKPDNISFRHSYRPIAVASLFSKIIEVLKLH